MPLSDSNLVRRYTVPIALRTTLIYAGIAALWILFSQMILDALPLSPWWDDVLDVLKGWLFVGVTASLLYISLRAQLRHQDRETVKGQKNEQRLRAVQEALLDGLVILRAVRREGRIVDFEAEYLNPAAERLLRSTGLVGEKALKAFPGLANHPLFLQMVRVVDTGEASDVELFYDTEGFNNWFRYSCVKYGDGVVLLFQDVSARKQAEDALHAREERLQFAMRGANDGLWDWNIETDEVYYSPRWKSMLGYAEHELENHFNTFKRLVHPEDLDFVMKNHTDLLEGRIDKYEVELRMRHKDGHFVNILSRALPFKSGDAKVTRLVGTHVDITKRKQAEEALRESERKFRVLSDNVPQRIFTKDRNSVYISCNSSYARDLGLDPMDIVGRTDYEFYPKELADGYRADDRRIMELGATTTIQERYLQSGREIWIETTKTPIRSEEGLVTGILGIFSDVTDRVQAENALRESGERLQLALRATHMGVWEWNIQTDELLWSPECAEIAGMKLERLTFDLFASYVHSEDVNRVTATINDAVANRTPFEAEFRFIRPNGEVRWLTNLGLPFDDESGTPSRMIGTVLDITERREAEAERRTLSRAVEYSPASIVITDPNGKIEYVNSKFTEITGYTLDEVRGENPRILKSGKTSPDEYTNLWSTIRDGHEWRGEFHNRKKSGELFWELASISPIFDSRNEITNFVAIKEDITDRKRSEQELLRVNRALRVLSECNEALIHMQDEPLLLAKICRVIHEVGGYVFAWVGYPENDVDKTVRPVAWAGREDGYLATARISWSEESEFGRGPAGGVIRTGAAQILQDLSTIQSFGPWLDMAKARGFASAMYLPLAEEGSIIGTLAIFSHERNAFVEEETRLLSELAGDLAFGIRSLRSRERNERNEHEKKALQAQLNHAQKMESIGRLAGGVAHDFNNMLSIILGYSQFAKTQLKPSDPLYADIIEIESAAMRSADLTRQLLAFARKQTTNPESLDLNLTISGMTKMLGRLIGEDIELIWEPYENLWRVFIDPSQVDQILANLSVNARDAISGAGSVVLQTSNVVLDGQTPFGGALPSPGDYVLLTVKDTGSGMSKDIADQIFEPFFTTKEQGKGTGLGLATVYGIVKQNNGFIQVSSEVGKGTQFSIYFPRFKDETPPASEESTAEAVQGGSETILLVEDEASILVLGKRTLSELGYTVLTANSPQEALKIVRDRGESIDLLITDVVMPEMNGRELAEAIVAIRSDIKCLYMSGYTADIIANRGVLQEGVQLLRKPFTLRGLAKEVRKALE